MDCVTTKENNIDFLKKRKKETGDDAIINFIVTTSKKNPEFNLKISKRQLEMILQGLIFFYMIEEHRLALTSKIMSDCSPRDHINLTLISNLVRILKDNGIETDNNAGLRYTYLLSLFQDDLDLTFDGEICLLDQISEIRKTEMKKFKDKFLRKVRKWVCNETFLKNQPLKYRISFKVKLFFHELWNKIKNQGEPFIFKGH
ncbi:MAG: hypothetical protein ACTSVV_11250, partial [Promethearchaeota archaeon]